MQLNSIPTECRGCCFGLKDWLPLRAQWVWGLLHEASIGEENDALQRHDGAVLCCARGVRRYEHAAVLLHFHERLLQGKKPLFPTCSLQIFTHFFIAPH